MEEVKDKMKGLMKEVNKSLLLSSTSGTFQGQGRVLGSASSSGAQPGGSAVVRRFSAAPPAAPADRPKPMPHAPRVESKPSGSPNAPDNSKPSDKFSPFDPLISSGKRSVNGSAPDVFACPVCSRAYASEEGVSVHVESCLAEFAADDRNRDQIEVRAELEGRVGEFISSGPPEESVEVVLRLLKNVVREPENEKFRRVRMTNPKIKQAVGTVKGAVEVLESVGFRLGEEGGETWAKMDLPVEEQIFLIKEAVTLLERWNIKESIPVPSGSAVDTLPEKKRVFDRQVRVFFSVPESEAAKIELPDSFYNLSAEELKREVELRKKKIAESQILIPRSYKEKQMKAARKRYKATCIRVQFPDGVVLQGVFLPWESTTVLYEFVSSSLKEPSLEFELLRPAFPKMQVIPRFSRPGGSPQTLEEEGLVPSALVKFKPSETDSVVFTGLADDLVETGEPLAPTAPAAHL